MDYITASYRLPGSWVDWDCRCLVVDGVMVEDGAEVVPSWAIGYSIDLYRSPDYYCQDPGYAVEALRDAMVRGAA